MAFLMILRRFSKLKEFFFSIFSLRWGDFKLLADIRLHIQLLNSFGFLDLTGSITGVYEQYVFSVKKNPEKLSFQSLKFDKESFSG